MATIRLVCVVGNEVWKDLLDERADLQGVEIVANEKMVPPPFPQKVLFTVSRPFTPRATDGAGRDRTREIASADGIYLGGFAPTRYQGIVAPHELMLDLPGARRGRKVMLYRDPEDPRRQPFRYPVPPAVPAHGIAVLALGIQ